MTKRSDFFFKYLSPQISLKNGSVLKTNLWVSGFKWNWPQPWFLFIFGKNKQTPWCNLLTCFKKIASWCLFIFAKNKQKPRLGSLLFETWHTKVRFEYWTIFEGYLWAEIFEKEIWPFGQSLIFNVNSHIFKIKNKSKLK